MAQNSTPPYVAITGMVGVGKTTLATTLAKLLDWELMTETVNQEDNPWLEPYYEAENTPNPYALPLQLYFILDRVKQLRQFSQQGQPFVADQCLEVDLGVFVRGHKEEGVLTEKEFKLLWQTYKQFRNHPQVPQPDLLIRLEAPFEVAMQRIKARNRGAEQDVQEEYWRRIYNRFQGSIPGCQNIPQLSLNAQKYDVRKPKDVRKIANIIKQKVGGQD